MVWLDKLKDVVSKGLAKMATIKRRVKAKRKKADDNKNDTVSENSTAGDEEDKEGVTVYRIYMKNTVWPVLSVPIMTFFTNEEAVKFVDEYPFMFLKSFLEIRKEERVRFFNTD